MAQYEIEVDSQDEYYDESSVNTTTTPDNINNQKIETNNGNEQVVRSVVKRKGRVFSAEEPSTQVLGGIKHFDTIKEEFSGRALRCKIYEIYVNLVLLILYPFIIPLYISLYLSISLYNSLSLAVEGWVIFVSNLNEEVTEEEVEDKFADFDKVRDVRLNLDHRTGYVKGYALVEFGEYKEAVEAIGELDGKEWLGNRLNLDFCFIKPTI